MTFKVGETVVYPHHGAALIEEMKTRTIKGEEKLYLKLKGQGVEIDLRADSSVTGPAGKQKLVTTFANIPDVPVDTFRLQINGGANGILKATNDVCGASKGTTVEFTGHNGDRTVKGIALTAPSCKPQVVSAKRRGGSRLAVRVGGIGGGKLALSGARFARATATIERSDTKLVTVRLSRSTVAQLNRGMTAKVKVKVGYAPASGAKTPAGQPAKPVSFTKTVTIKGKKVGRR